MLRRRSKDKLRVGEVHVDTSPAHATTTDDDDNKCGFSAVSSLSYDDDDDVEHNPPPPPPPPPPSSSRHLETMKDAESAAAVIMSLKLELAEARTSMDVSLQSNRDLTAANDTLSSSLESARRSRDHFRHQLEQTRNVVSSMQKAARKAGTERAELRVQAEMLRNENERCRGYAKLRDECQRLRMDNRRLREQLAQAQQQLQRREEQLQQQLQQLQQHPAKVSSSSTSSLLGYRYANTSNSSITAANSIFSPFSSSTTTTAEGGHLGSLSGVDNLPQERLRAHRDATKQHQQQQQQLGMPQLQQPPVCTNEAPKRDPPCVLQAMLSRDDNERASARRAAAKHGPSTTTFPRRASLLNILSGLGAASGDNHHHQKTKKKALFGCQEDNDEEKEAIEKRTMASNSRTWRAAAADLPKVRIDKQKMNDNFNSTTTKKKHAKGGNVNSSNRSSSPSIFSRRRWSGSNLDVIDLEKLRDDDNDSDDDEEDNSSDEVTAAAAAAAGDILVPWRHDIVAERRRAGERSNSDSNIAGRTSSIGIKKQDGTKTMNSLFKDDKAAGALAEEECSILHRRSLLEEQQAQQRQGDTKQTLRAGDLDDEKHKEEGVDNDEGSARIAGASSVPAVLSAEIISAEDAARLMLSSQLPSPAEKCQPQPPLSQPAQTSLFPQEKEKEKKEEEEEAKYTMTDQHHHQQEEERRHSEYHDLAAPHHHHRRDESADDRTNLTLGTADDVERFFSDMMDDDEPLSMAMEDDVLRDLEGHLDDEKGDKGVEREQEEHNAKDRRRHPAPLVGGARNLFGRRMACFQ